jgi:hypothetical protein
VTLYVNLAAILALTDVAKKEIGVMLIDGLNHMIIAVRRQRCTNAYIERTACTGFFLSCKPQRLAVTPPVAAFVSALPNDPTTAMNSYIYPKSERYTISALGHDW